MINNSLFDGAEWQLLVSFLSARLVLLAFVTETSNGCTESM